MSEIKQIIMQRDNISSDEADDLIFTAKEQLNEYLKYGDFSAAEDVCKEFFGLEPDYVWELLY